MYFYLSGCYTILSWFEHRKVTEFEGHMFSTLLSSKRNPFFLFGIIILLSLLGCNQSGKPLYKDAKAPINKRVEDLLSRMTLEEKVSQLYGIGIGDTSAFDSHGNYLGSSDTTRLKLGVGSFGISRLGGTPKLRAEQINSIQKYLLQHSRLGIPGLVFSEALHGFMANGATSFPQAIALGSTWDTLLVEQVFQAAGLEARSRGTTQVLAPVLDLARDPRWGRTEECYSEDPYLASRIGMAAVFGLQGRADTINNDHVATTLKHFAGHGEPKGGRNIAPLNYGERYFRENFLYPFKMAVQRAHAQSLMASYNEWDGVPNHVNYKLLTEILRNEWGFDGYVMSDGGGMSLLYGVHHVAKDTAEAGRMAIEAGLDYALGSYNCFTPLVREVRNGVVPEADIDRAVSGILRVKFRLGLFDHPFVDPNKAAEVTNDNAHKALALKAAEEAMILLKNDHQTLPFDSTKMKTLAVIGPNAAGIHLGGYSPVPMHGIDVLQGIRDYAKNRFKVEYAEGCKITTNKVCNWLVNEKPVPNTKEDDERLIAQAVRTAKNSDAVLLVLGGNELTDREAWNEEHLGDRDNLDLLGRQDELAKAVIATGKPVVVLLINGRPLTINYLQDHADAIIEGWYLGEETGPAVANVLFGRANPSGKLTITFPRSVGQLPDFYDKKPSDFRHYVWANSTPLYPFGYGLSYTTFVYSNLKISPKQILPDGIATVSVDVQNTGTRAGDEVAEMYIHDIISFPTRPVQELRSFARVQLNPGQTKTVTFKLNKEKLEALDLNMKNVVQPGAFEIMVGGSSASVIRDTLMVAGKKEI
ncbi:MAG TPA: glycoside hydrolase family 3 N-terminal domain-containing protein [Balneolales bacterium]|nr:glycoside hydrolase family 3 N-terminal domain-containing protein [Balneolales bacterium]